MALDVGTLVHRLTLDDSGFTRAIEGDKKHLKDLGDTAKSAAQTVERSASDQAKAYNQLRGETEKYATAAKSAHSKAETSIEAQRIAEERLQDVQRRSGSTAKEIEQAEKVAADARKRAERAMDQARTAADQYEASHRRASRAAEAMGDMARDASRDVSKLTESTDQAATSAGKIGDAVKDAGGKLTGLAGQISEKAGMSGGGNFVAGFTSKIGVLGAAGGPITAALAGVTAIGVAAGGVLAGAIADGMAIQKSMKFTQAQLGVGDEVMQDIGRAASSAFANGFGESMAANMDAARAAIQSGILTGEEDTNTFRQTIEGLNTVADLMGEEVPAVARSAGQAIKNGLAKDGVGAFDLLVAAQRNNLNVSGDLLDSFDEYSTQLRALGIDGIEGWALVSQGVQGGARDTDVVIDALKEFKLRVTDGTAAAAEGFEALKVPADEAQEAMAKGGTAARDMMARLLNGLHDIKDPQDRYNAALALFGTKFEDIQGAVDSMDLDTAVQQFGQVGGAAQQAAGLMSDPIASARNTVTAAMDDVKLALAESFGPELANIANQVSTHKPEIIEFFTGLAGAALDTGEAFLRFVQGALNVIGPFAAITGEALAGVVVSMGDFVGAAASVADALNLPFADGLKGASDDLKGFAGKLHDNSGALLDLADKAGAGAEILGGLSDRVADAGAEAANSETMMRALGDTIVNEVPDEKSIIISDNQPEAVQRLKDLGMEVTNTPNGIRVTAKTQEAEDIMRDFINRDRTASVRVTLDTSAIAAKYGIGSQDAIRSAFLSRDVNVNANGSIRQRANGGLDDLAEPIIKRGQGNGSLYQTPLGPVQAFEGETAWEAFIPGAPSKRRRAEEILAEVAKRFGFGLVSTARSEAAKIFAGDPKSLTDRTDPTGWRALLGGDYNGKLSRLGIEEDSPLVDAALSARKAIIDGDFDGNLTKYGIEEDSPIAVALLALNEHLFKMANGGIVEGMSALVNSKFPALTITDTYRPGANDNHGAGRAIDVSNGSGNTDEQLAFANWVADNYPNSAELIYDDPRFDRQIKNGKFVDRGFYAGAGDHTHHVHWAMSDIPGTPATEAAPSAPEAPPVDTRTNKERHVDEVIAEGKRRGMSDKQIKAAVMTMLAESDGVMYANASDPESMNFPHEAVGSDHDSSGLFQQRNNGAWGTAADRMDPAKSAGMFYEELAKLDQNAMSEAQLAQAVQRSAFSDGSNYAARASEADALIAGSNARSSAVASTTTDSGVSMSTDGQRVFVTNWPSGGGSFAEVPTTSAPSPSSHPPAPSPTGVEEAPATDQPWDTPPTPQERISEWAQEAGPAFAESWGFPKPGGVLGALLDPANGELMSHAAVGINNEATKQLEEVIRLLREVAANAGDTFYVADIEEALRKRDQIRAAKTLTWLR